MQKSLIIPLLVSTIALARNYPYSDKTPKTSSSLKESNVSSVRNEDSNHVQSTTRSVVDKNATDTSTVVEEEIKVTRVVEPFVINSPISISPSCTGIGVSLSLGYRINASIVLPSGPNVNASFIEVIRGYGWLAGVAIGRTQYLLGVEKSFTTARTISNNEAFALMLGLKTKINLFNFLRSFIPLTQYYSNFLSTDMIVFGIGVESLTPTDRIKLAKVFIQANFYLDNSLHIHCRLTKGYAYDQFTSITGMDPNKSLNEVQSDYLSERLEQVLEEEDDIFSFFENKKDRADSLVDSLRRSGSLAQTRQLGNADLSSLMGGVELTVSVDLSTLI